jgi:hypothetical protein
MANIFKPKRSNTPLSTPTTSNLVDGELAVNSADRRVYLRDGSDIVAIANKSISSYGIQYLFDSDTANADPGSGQIRFNVDVTTVTNDTSYEAYVSETDANSLNVAAVLDTLTESDSNFKAFVVVYKEQDQSINFKFQVTGQTDNGTYRTLNIDSVGTPNNWASVSANDDLFFTISITGDKGETGEVTTEQAIAFAVVL